jgi:transposase-like protein
LIEGRLSSQSGRNEPVQLATRLIVEESVEAEVRDAPGRDYYAHGGGYRNGVRGGRLNTAEGSIDYAAPRVAGSEALEDLAIETLELPALDIEDAFRDESGRFLLSRTAVSELGERLCADYQEFATRDLNEYEIAYLFVDGIAGRIRPEQRREPVLAAWWLAVEGK